MWIVGMISDVTTTAPTIPVALAIPAFAAVLAAADVFRQSAGDRG
jgi:hypothetical protein